VAKLAAIAHKIPLSGEGDATKVLMVSINQIWDVDETIEYMKHMADLKLWYDLMSRFHGLLDSLYANLFSRFIEELTFPDDILGHAKIRNGLKPYVISVATGNHVNNRVIFKQPLQAGAIEAVQLDACRLCGVH
jgi:hypothetical protein